MLSAVKYTSLEVATCTAADSGYDGAAVDDQTGVVVDRVGHDDRQAQQKLLRVRGCPRPAGTRCWRSLTASASVAQPIPVGLRRCDWVLRG